MGWNDFRLAAVGERYDNEDGTSRQAELARMAPGDGVLLVREPSNPHDPRAVSLRSERGVTVGYLSRDHASWVGSKIDRGYAIEAIVHRIKGETMAGSALGLVILVNMEGDAPELEGDAGLPPMREPTRAAA